MISNSVKEIIDEYIKSIKSGNKIELYLIRSRLKALNCEIEETVTAADGIYAYRSSDYNAKIYHWIIRETIEPLRKWYFSYNPIKSISQIQEISKTNSSFNILWQSI